MRNSLEQAREITMRHEEKYLCPESWLFVMEHRLREFLQPDKHHLEGGYSIRSLYFDTEDDRLYTEGMNGLGRKDKYRIRIYNGGRDFIRLEKKTTVMQLKKKASTVVDSSFVEKILDRDSDGGIQGGNWLSDRRDPVLREFGLMENTELLRPKIIVDYVRTAFVSEMGDIRITFDRNIRTTDRVGAFFEDDVAFLPLLPENVHLLEVKYSGIFPGYLARLLNIGSLERLSFSKYVLCRDMIMNNGRMRELYEF